MSFFKLMSKIFNIITRNVWCLIFLLAIIIISGDSHANKGNILLYDIGSGFYVSDHLILTNFHVIENCKSAIGVTNKFLAPQTAEVIAKDENLDIALIQTQKKASAISYIRSNMDLKLGDKVMISGYPEGKYEFSEAKITTLRDANGREYVSENQFFLSDKVRPGNSGSPLLDNGGNVIGVVSARAEGSNVTPAGVAIGIFDLKKFLSNNRVPYRPAYTSVINHNPRIIEETAKKFTVFVYCITG